MNRLLERILHKLKLDQETQPSVEQWQAILEKIDQTYLDFEQDRQLLEHSLELTSEEMGARLQKITDIEQQRLSTANKLASLGEMAGEIAHEINTPLAIIDGYAMMLEVLIDEKNLDPEEFTEKIKKIRHTVNRVGKIVRSLKNFSRNGDIETPIETTLDTVIDETMELCSDKFRNNGIKIILSDNYSEIKVICNPVQIAQVILNLMTNAHDALLEHDIKDKWVKIEAVEQEGKVCISVSDAGAGIPPEIAEKIMGAYFTTKKRDKGTGLGLSICKKIINDHHGTIFVDTRVKNTCFTFELPKKKGGSRDDGAAPSL